MWYDDALEGRLLGQVVELYHTLAQTLRVMPRAIRATRDRTAKRRLLELHKLVQGRLTRVQQVVDAFERGHLLEETPIEFGQVQQMRAMIESHRPGIVRDAGILLAASRVVHYETCVYRVVIDLSLASGWEAVAAHLQASLTESEQVLGNLSRTVGQLVRPEPAVSRREASVARWFATGRDAAPSAREGFAIPA